MNYFDCNVIAGWIRNGLVEYKPVDILHLMDKAGIKSALCASSTGYQSNDVIANNITYEMAKKDPRLISVGTIHPTRYFNVEEEISKRKEQGFKAFRLFTEFYEVNFDSFQMKEYFHVLDKYKIPLIVSSTDIQLNSNYLEGIARRASEVSIPVIVLNVSGYRLGSAIPCAKAVENLYFGTRLIYTNRALELLCEKLGSERLLLASGIPYFYAMQSIQYINMADISDKDRTNILGDNLRRILK